MARFSSALSGARAAVLTAAILTLSASQAAAQYGEPKKIEITPFGGWYIASDLYVSNNSKIGISDAFMYGARLGIFPNSRLGIEATWGHTSSDLKVQTFSVGFPTNTPLGTLTTDQWDGNFIFTQHNMGNPRSTGFFTIGFGATNFSVDTNRASGSASNTRFAWNIGIGTKYDMSEKVALRLDGRYRSVNTNVNTSNGVYCDIYGYCYSYASNYYDTGEISMGLAYKLGN